MIHGFSHDSTDSMANVTLSISLLLSLSFTRYYQMVLWPAGCLARSRTSSWNTFQVCEVKTVNSLAPHMVMPLTFLERSTRDHTHNITHVYSILLNTDAFAVCSWMIDWILGLLSELLWQCKLFFVFIVYEWQQLLSPCTQTECCQESRTLSVAVCIVVHTQTLLLSYSSYLLLTKDFQGCLLTNMAWFLNYGNTVSPTKHRRHNI